jgi:hypothetical protein
MEQSTRMTARAKLSGVYEIQMPKIEAEVRRTADPDATKEEVRKGIASFCVDHLCGCPS